LVKSAGVSVYAGEVGGVHPALVEAMAAGKPILCLDNPANRETVGDCAIMFERSVKDLSEKMLAITRDKQMRDELSRRAAERAKANYGWEEVTGKYELLFEELIAPNAKPKRTN
jgi:glycosyltransferase involved in cell wall biosynthesis